MCNSSIIQFILLILVLYNLYTLYNLSTEVYYLLSNTYYKFNKFKNMRI